MSGNGLISASVLGGELSEMSNEQLIEMLQSILKDVTAGIIRVVEVVKELDRRHVDLGFLKMRLVGWCRKVYRGQMDAELMLTFAAKPHLISRFSRLPIDDQARLASGKPVEMAVLREGSTDVRMIDPVDMTVDQLRVVFAPDRIRTVKEQIPLIEEAAMLAARKAEPIEQAEVVEVTVKFSLQEYNRLRRLASKQGLEPHELLHRVV